MAFIKRQLDEIRSAKITFEPLKLAMVADHNKVGRVTTGQGHLFLK